MILLTGFEPFAGSASNPSWGAVERARGILRSEGWAVESVELPCVFGDALVALRAALDAYDPELVVCVGQAGGRPGISLERVAINCDDARIPDNAGNQPVDQDVVPGGPAAYFSSLPIKAGLLALRSAGIPADVSQSAGTYVCNHVFYGLMHELRNRSGTRGGFVHVPLEAARPPGGSTPTLPIDVTAEALAVVVRTSLRTAVDLKLPAGAVH